MLTIRAEQLQALDAAFEASLLRSLAAWLQERHTARVAGLSSEELMRRVECALARSRACGMDTVGAHRRYLVICLALGWEFHAQLEHRWVEECLRNRALGPPLTCMMDVLETLRNDLSERTRPTAEPPAEPIAQKGPEEMHVPNR